MCLAYPLSKWKRIPYGETFTLGSQPHPRMALGQGCGGFYPFLLITGLSLPIPSNRASMPPSSEGPIVWEQEVQAWSSRLIQGNQVGRDQRAGQELQP